jgi:hypothetical protein
MAAIADVRRDALRSLIPPPCLKLSDCIEANEDVFFDLIDRTEGNAEKACFA